jgi:hypothetical protein
MEVDHRWLVRQEKNGIETASLVEYRSISRLLELLIPLLPKQ